MNSWRPVALTTAFAAVGGFAAEGVPVEVQEASPEVAEGPWRMSAR